MSDASGTQGEPAGPNKEQPYRSEFDDLFSAAWNDVYDEEDDPEAGEGGDPAAAPGTGEAAPAAPGQGAGTTDPAAGAPAPGADPAALAELAGALQTAGGAPVPGADPAAAAAAAAAGVGGDAAAPLGVEADTVIPLFETANNAINERMNTSFKSSAEEEVRNEIDPEYFNILDRHPFEIVGQDVPSIRPNEKTFKPRDVAEATAYLEATKRLIDREIETKTQAKITEARPVVSMLQESALMFSNNPDLIPNTVQYDAELAKLFTDTAKTYERRVDGKLYGYAVPVQPLINSLRAMLAKQRGVTGEQNTQARREAAQRQAASMTRQPNGQFVADAPQAGIESTAALSGKPSDDDDYSPFWNALGMGKLGNM